MSDDTSEEEKAEADRMLRLYGVGRGRCGHLYLELVEGCPDCDALKELRKSARLYYAAEDARWEEEARRAREEWVVDEAEVARLRRTYKLDVRDLPSGNYRKKMSLPHGCNRYCGALFPGGTEPREGPVPCETCCFARPFAVGPSGPCRTPDLTHEEEVA